MKGAIAVPCVRNRSDVIRIKATTIGNSQNFFRSLKKSQNSFKNSSIEVPSKSSKLMCYVKLVLTADHRIRSSLGERQFAPG
jgi:hypothetical protein